MASPQCENGFLKLAHELVRVFIRTRVSGRVKDSVLAVAERTWGYGLTDAVIPTATLAGDMGLATGDVRKVLNQAVALNMIIKVERGKASAPRWRVNKDYSTWRCDIRTRKPEKSTGYLDGTSQRARGGEDALPSGEPSSVHGGVKQSPRAYPECAADGGVKPPPRPRRGETAPGGGETATPLRGGETAPRSKKGQKESAAVPTEGEGGTGQNPAAAECVAIQPQKEETTYSDLDVLTEHYLARFRERLGAAYGYGAETARRVLGECLAAADDPADVMAAVDAFFEAADIGDGGPPLFRVRLPGLLVAVRRERAEAAQRERALDFNQRRLDDEERAREESETWYARIEAHVGENRERLEKEARARLEASETWMMRHFPAQAMAQTLEDLAAAELGVPAGAERVPVETGGRGT